MSGNEICRMAAKGCVDAERFCVAWVDFAHLMDDCADRDKSTGPDRIASTLAAFILELSGNPFFLANKAMLLGLMIQSAQAWADSDKRQPEERDVLKGMYHEVVFHVAFLVGGWNHLQHVTSECREYQFEKEVARGSV